MNQIMQKEMINLFYDSRVLIKENQLYDELKKLVELNKYDLDYLLIKELKFIRLFSFATKNRNFS